MKGDKIKYRSGYKYQLDGDYSVQLKYIIPSRHIDSEYISLTENGLLTIKHGYAWDGPSGPTVDSKSFMRGSLVHDVIYQLIRQNFLSIANREAADLELIEICKEDGMGFIRRKYVFYSLRRFGLSAALPENDKTILSAP